MSKADITRMNILNKALLLVYKNGYQSTSIDEIIATTSVTKGALYYHFKSKDEMGLAIIKDLMYPQMYLKLTQSLLTAENPKQGIYEMMEGILGNEEFFDVKYGCPVVNMIQEMAPLNDKFATALRKLFSEWKNAIIQCLEKGKTTNKIKTDVNSEQVAIFILSGYSGIRNLGKIMGKACYIAYLKELKSYILTL